MRTALFSIISPNYRHFARVLMGSARRHHPEWDRFVLVAGGAADPRPEEPFTSVPLEALPLPHARQFCFRYTLLELDTAVKPWMFEHLFARGYDRVVYLDPDICVYSPLAEVAAAAPETFLTLTPHLTGFIGGDDFPSERTILQAGTYNLGFLAVCRQPSLPAFLSWWQGKLERQCVVDVARGLFVDQKWMDLTPGLFPGVTILRHEGYNVAYWNLEHRKLLREGAGATVNGQPLRFFHFSGFDPSLGKRVSRHHHALGLGEVGDVRHLIEEYRAALVAAGGESFRDARYAFGAFADGTPVPDAARLAYRESPELQAACGDDPFARPELFTGFRDAPKRPPRAARAGVAWYRLLSRARPLVGLIPRPARTAMREFLLGRREGRAPRSPDAAKLAAGLNVVGYLSRDTGVGESARACRRACDAAGLPIHLVDVDAPFPPRAVHRASIYHVNGDQLLSLREEIPQLFASSACNIGVWHWELPELPDAWSLSAGPLDEIWAPSAFVQSAAGRKLTIPVVHMPHGVSVEEIEPCPPAVLGVPPGRFTFLCMFDLGSVLSRKNPLGAVEAFRRAFPREAPVALLVKAGHAEAHPAEWAELKERLGGVPNVTLTDRMLTRPRVNGLLAACDGVVSLHRSEGFGLILAEAMALGKPVVATGWSGNMDFMTGENSLPVGYELVPLDRDHGSYGTGQEWAEPDVGQAAHLMRRVVEDSDLRSRLGERAKETIRTRFSPEAAGRRYRRRLASLGLLEEKG